MNDYEYFVIFAVVGGLNQTKSILKNAKISAKMLQWTLAQGKGCYTISITFDISNTYLGSRP